MTTYNYDSTTQYISPIQRITENTTGNGKFITSKYLTFDDYHSCSIERANVQYIIDNYSKNRYIQILGAYGYTQIYLKNTKLNQQLIDSLDHYPSIDDEYLSHWERDKSLEQFLDSNLVYFPVIFQALEKIDPDRDWIPSPQLYNCVNHFSELWFCGESYIFEGSKFYFNLERDNVATADNVNLVYDYLLDNPIYSPMDKLLTIDQSQSIINRLYYDSKTSSEPYYYCLQVQSYTNIVLFAGSSDYMTTHEFPFQEIIIDPHTTKRDIIELFYHTYTSICDYNY